MFLPLFVLLLCNRECEECVPASIRLVTLQQRVWIICFCLCTSCYFATESVKNMFVPLFVLLLFKGECEEYVPASVRLVTLRRSVWIICSCLCTSCYFATESVNNMFLPLHVLLLCNGECEECVPASVRLVTLQRRVWRMCSCLCTSCYFAMESVKNVFLPLYVLILCNGECE